MDGDGGLQRRLEESGLLNKVEVDEDLDLDLDDELPSDIDFDRDDGDDDRDRGAIPEQDRLVDAVRMAHDDIDRRERMGKYQGPIYQVREREPNYVPPIAAHAGKDLGSDRKQRTNPQAKMEIPHLDRKPEVQVQEEDSDMGTDPNEGPSLVEEVEREAIREAIDRERDEMEAEEQEDEEEAKSLRGLNHFRAEDEYALFGEDDYNW